MADDLLWFTGSERTPRSSARDERLFRFTGGTTRRRVLREVRPGEPGSSVHYRSEELRRRARKFPVGSTTRRVLEERAVLVLLSANAIRTR